MVIMLDGNMLSVCAGQVVTGMIHVQLQEGLFHSDMLTLTL